MKEKIIQLIVSSNAYVGCKEVLQHEEIATIEYSAKTQETLLQILQNGSYELLALFEPVKDLLGEELTVIRFSDEKGKKYFGLYCDSIELRQDPEIIAIVPSVW